MRTIYCYWYSHSLHFCRDREWINWINHLENAFVCSKQSTEGQTKLLYEAACVALYIFSTQLFRRLILSISILFSHAIIIIHVFFLASIIIVHKYCYRTYGINYQWYKWQRIFTKIHSGFNQLYILYLYIRFAALFGAKVEFFRIFSLYMNYEINFIFERRNQQHIKKTRKVLMITRNIKNLASIHTSQSIA